MKNIFNIDNRHSITEANINFYANPFVHPERIMNEHDFIYVLDGEWKIGQNDDIYTIDKDKLLVLSAGNRHYGISECTKGTRTMYFHISCESGDYSSLSIGKPKDNQMIIDTLINAEFNRSIKRIFHEIVTAKLSFDDRKASILFDLLLCEISSVQNYTSSDELGEKIKNIIHLNPEKFLSNTYIADEVNVSLKTAETKFKSQFGITIHRYILEFKTEQAISFFKNFPEMPIKEIAYNLGFYDEYHFSKQFKKITGISPKEYKKSIYENMVLQI